MPYADPEKAKIAMAERCRRYRARKHAERYGPNAGSQSGKHGNQARGEANGRWNRGSLITSDGYVLIRVPLDFPHAFGPQRLRYHRYAYEHIVVMVKHIGRSLDAHEVVHHRNGNRNDNRLENLELTTRSDHAREHGNSPWARDFAGKFKAGVKRPTVRQFPEVARASH